MPVSLQLRTYKFIMAAVHLIKLADISLFTHGLRSNPATCYVYYMYWIVNIYLISLRVDRDTILIFKTDLISVVTNGGGKKDTLTNMYVQIDYETCGSGPDGRREPA